MTDYAVETVVVGAGVVGLACAAALAETGREVLVLERNGYIGEEVSSRNSEVIHAGIYYPHGSLKARLCVEGKQKLYRYCKQHRVTARRLGKLIVAADADDLIALKTLLKRGKENGVEDLVWLEASEAKAMEPALECLGALYSPSTGTVDSHGLMLSLQGDLEQADGVISFYSAVQRLEVGKKLKLQVDSRGETFTIDAQEVINCAGLDAVDLAHSSPLPKADTLPQGWFAKGNYFRLKGPAPFSRLVYPAPSVHGLGVHMTLDLSGNARFGPDVEDMQGAHYRDIDLAVNPDRAERFYQRIRSYWPDLPDDSLEPDYAGIRPKIRRGEMSPMDFEILDKTDHGISGLVHCLGVESPGLTSSLAIAEEVVARLTSE